MAWRVQFGSVAEKQLKKLDSPVQRRVLTFVRDRLMPSTDPRAMGEALKGDLKTFWKYRLGGYRMVCDIRDIERVILVLKIGHRREVYR